MTTPFWRIATLALVFATPWMTGAYPLCDAGNILSSEATWIPRNAIFSLIGLVVKKSPKVTKPRIVAKSFCR